MKLLLLLLTPLLISACDKGSAAISNLGCPEPEFHKNNNTDHNSGFNWAKTYGGDCNGHSEAFKSGCIEYYDQLRAYNKCVSSRNK